jgi:enoyl-CoA hydratase/carnithine racemase
MEAGVSGLRRIGKATLARINGICVGGGNELQMACDLAVMVDDAFIRHVGLQHGSVPAAGATQWLPLIVGDRRAREIILLCEEIPAAQALEWGLVNRVVPAADLDATVDELVAKLADRLPTMTRYARRSSISGATRLAWDDPARARLAPFRCSRARPRTRCNLPRPTKEKE